MQHRSLLVTHHQPDLDAIGAVWMLMRHDSQNFGTAKLAFVNPGETITLEAAQDLGFELHQATHVDTGLGEFDHHQSDRGQEFTSASLLTYQHICQIHPEYTKNKPLKTIAEFITEIDHFREIDWPESGHIRYAFMIHELIKGLEYSERHSDENQVHFGMTCLDSAYGVLTQHYKALEILDQEGEQFLLHDGPGLAVETSSDEVIKLAQKQGSVLVIRKDPNLGHIRIKVRPDAQLSLEKLYDAIKEQDSEGSWYFHPSGKMLLNGSDKHRDQKASPLTLNQVVAMTKELYS
ncbi:MAG: hypothetical protein WDZ94_03575 [Patescibacteria group bacterium]